MENQERLLLSHTFKEITRNFDWLVVSVVLQIVVAKTLGTVKRINKRNKQRKKKEKEKKRKATEFLICFYSPKRFITSNTFFKIQVLKKYKKKIRGYTAFWCTLEVLDSSNTSIVLSFWFVQLYASPLATGKFCCATKS